MRIKTLAQSAVVTAVSGAILMGVGSPAAAAVSPTQRPTAAVSSGDLSAVAPESGRAIIVYALRHGGVVLSRLVASLDAEAGRQILLHSRALADFIEKASVIDRAAIVGFLTRLGVPATAAGAIADVILRFIG